MTTAPPIALIACEVFLDEIEAAAAGRANIVSRRLLEIGLHDRPDQMRATLQPAIDEADARDDVGAIVLGYGLCGLGTAGLGVARHPLVIPKAHDCIGVLLGGREKHAARQAACPGCHYYSPGWNRARRVPGPGREAFLREQWGSQFDPEDVDFLLETEKELWRHYDTAVFISHGTPGAEEEREYARGCAEWLGWKFEAVRGDPALLRDLLTGPWDEQRFLVVPPGGRIASSNDEDVMKVVPRESSQ